MAIVLIETGLSLALPENLMTRSIAAKKQLAQTRESPDLLFMGDSVALGCLRPGIFRDRLRREPGLEHVVVDNYAVAGTTPVDAYYLLKKQLKAGKRPNLIIYAPNAAVMTTPALERFYGRNADWGETLESLQHGVAPHEVLYGLLFKLSFTMRYREEIRNMLTTGKTQFIESLFRTLSELPDRDAPVGEPPEEVPPPQLDDITPRDLPPMLRQPFSPHPAVRGHLEHLFELTRKHEVPVLFLSLPIPEVIAELNKESGADQQYQAFLDWVDSFQNVLIINHQRSVLPNGHFGDFWHLTPYAAYHYSQATAEELVNFLEKHPDLREELIRD